MEVKAQEKSLIEEDFSCRQGENKRCCAYCKTTRTPLWRAGPTGPKSLCNACGIKYRKNRRAEKNVELGEGPEKIDGRVTTEAIVTSTTTCTDSVSARLVDSSSTGNGLSRSLKLKLMVYRGKLLLKRSSSVVKKERCQRRRKLGEEEEAAFSLMALSCGSVFA